MNTTEADKQSETREARAAAPPAESFDAESAASNESAEYRETVERGYGWGV